MEETTILELVTLAQALADNYADYDHGPAFDDRSLTPIERVKAVIKSEDFMFIDHAILDTLNMAEITSSPELFGFLAEKTLALIDEYTTKRPVSRALWGLGEPKVFA